MKFDTSYCQFPTILISMHENRHVSLHKGNGSSKQNYQYTFAGDQHQMQTYHFEELLLAQMPNHHNSNPYLFQMRKESDQ